MQYNSPIIIKKQGLAVNTRQQALKTLCLPVLLALAPVFAQAQQSLPAPAGGLQSTQALKYTNNLHLGYIRTTSAQINSNTETALRNLQTEVKTRTAVKAEGVAGLDPETDDLSFFHFLYWPVTPDARPLSDKARLQVQHYLDTGGVILFDLRDANGMMRDQRALRRLLADLSIPPLMNTPADHPTVKGFYLLSNLPGTSAHGATWTEVPASKGVEKVSSTIIGDRNWGDAWAGKSVLPGTREREMALRTGINLVLYAYMGNAKLEPINKQLDILKRD